MKKFTKAIAKAKRALISEGFETIDSYQNDEMAEAPELADIADQTPSQREKTLDWFKDHNASHSLIAGIEELIDLAKDYEDADKKDSDLYDEIVKLARELEDKFHANPALVKSGIKKFGDIKKGDEELETRMGELGAELEGEESELFGELLGLDLGMLNHFKAFFKQHNASKKFIENFEKFLNKAGEYQKSGKKDKNLYNEIMTIGRELDAEIYSNKSLLKSIIKAIGASQKED